MIKTDKKIICLLLLIALLIFHVINNFIFISNYPLAEGKDSYAHITAFNNFCQIMENGKLNPFYVQGKSLLHNLIFVVIDYPPLFYFSAFILKFLFGGFLMNVSILNATVYLLILLGAVYSIGEMINPETGIIAAFVCGMYPMIFLSSRHFSLELMLCSISALSILIVLKTNFLLSRKYSILLGIVLGLGMLTKQTFFIYVSGPFLAYAVYSFKNCRTGIKQQMIENVLICCAIFLGIGSLFYLNKDMYANVFNRVRFLGAVNNANLFSAEHASYYLRSLKSTLGIFFCAVFFASFVYIQKITGHLRIMLISWICVPLVFFTLIILKYGEYSIPYLPAMALISSAAIVNIKNLKFRRIVIMTVIVFGFLNYYNLTSAKRVMFYSTYHAVNPRCEIFSYSDGSFASTTDNSMQKVIKDIGNKNHKVGIFYDFSNLEFPSYLVRSVFALTKNKAQKVDFLFRSSVFKENLNAFDVMIYITRSQRQWTDMSAFSDFIRKFNADFSADIKVSNDFIDRLVLQKEKFRLINFIKFYSDSNSPATENVFIYKREK